MSGYYVPPIPQRNYSSAPAVALQVEHPPAAADARPKQHTRSQTDTSQLGAFDFKSFCAGDAPAPELPPNRPRKGHKRSNTALPVEPAPPVPQRSYLAGAQPTSSLQPVQEGEETVL